MTLQRQKVGPSCKKRRADTQPNVSQKLAKASPIWDPPCTGPDGLEALPEAPVYHPTEVEFRDPLAFIASVRAEAETYGICRIIPPAGWQPPFMHATGKLKFHTKRQDLSKLEGDQRMSQKFLENLRKLLFVLGKPMPAEFKGAIKLDGRPINLFRLFKVVKLEGGFKTLTQLKDWTRVCEQVGFGGTAASGASAGDTKAGAHGELDAAVPPRRAVVMELKGVYERYLLDLEACGQKHLSGRPLRRSGICNSREVSHPELRIGSTFWRHFEDLDECLLGTIKTTRGNTFLVEYCRTEAKDGAPEGAAMQDRETLHKGQLRTLTVNGDTQEKARLVSTGQICEVCDSAEPEGVLIGCQGCGCHFHHTCLIPVAPANAGQFDWFCGPCVEDIATVQSAGLGALMMGDTLQQLKPGDPPAPRAPAGMRSRTSRRASNGSGGSAAEHILTFGFTAGGSFEFAEFVKQGEAWRKAYLESRGLLEGVCNRKLESEFWSLVGPSPPVQGLQVLYGSDLDTSFVGSGFPNAHNRSPKQTPARPQARPLADGGSAQAGMGMEVEAGTMYHGHAYDKDQWNLNVLPTAAGSLLQHLSGRVTGVVVPWLYVGSMFSAFCWHNEDHHLYSINYHHWGADKRWYGVAGGHAQAFETAMKAMYPELFEAHPDLLMHLVTMAHPAELSRRGVPVCCTTQRKGEFVITFPQAYHAGFNLGVNCAEAVNFAPPDWLPYGHAAQERYRTFRKAPVFSQEGLVLALVRAITTASREGGALSNVPELVPLVREELGDMARRQSELRARAKAAGCRTFQAMSYLFERVQASKKVMRVKALAPRDPSVGDSSLSDKQDDSPNKGPQCHVCQQYCVLEAVLCTECTGARGAAYPPLVCGHHLQQLCSCRPVHYIYFSRHSVAELQEMAEQLSSKGEDISAMQAEIAQLAGHHRSWARAYRDQQENRQHPPDEAPQDLAGLVAAWAGRPGTARITTLLNRAKDWGAPKLQDDLAQLRDAVQCAKAWGDMASRAARPAPLKGLPLQACVGFKRDREGGAVAGEGAKGGLDSCAPEALLCQGLRLAVRMDKEARMLCRQLALQSAARGAICRLLGLETPPELSRQKALCSMVLEGGVAHGDSDGEGGGGTSIRRAAVASRIRSCSVSAPLSPSATGVWGGHRWRLEAKGVEEAVALQRAAQSARFQVPELAALEAALCAITAPR